MAPLMAMTMRRGNAAALQRLKGKLEGSPGESSGGAAALG
jgi:hypothetical protein